MNGTDRAGNGVAQAISGYQDPDVCCEVFLCLVCKSADEILGADIPWIQNITKLPLVIKG